MLISNIGECRLNAKRQCRVAQEQEGSAFSSGTIVNACIHAQVHTRRDSVGDEISGGAC